MANTDKDKSYQPATMVSPYPSLSLPPTQLRIDRQRDGYYVYDRWRERMVALTPEEWVRQHFVAWLTEVMGYPSSRIATEVSLMLNRTLRRADAIVYDNRARPLMVIEFKRPTVIITRDVFEQAIRYNMTLGAKYIVVSNGICHFICKYDKSSGTYGFMRQIPSYEQLEQ